MKLRQEEPGLLAQALVVLHRIADSNAVAYVMLAVNIGTVQ